MENSILGIIIEVLMAVLLLATISYCIIVNRKLDSLRQNRQGLTEIIQQLYQATSQAEAAISDLKTTVSQSEKELALRIDEARTASEIIGKKISKGQFLTSQVTAQNGNPPASITSEKSALRSSDRAELWAQLNLKKLSENSSTENLSDKETA